MGNAITQPARTFEKKVLGVEDRAKSKVVKSGINDVHFTAATFQNGNNGTTSIGLGGNQVSLSTNLNM